jgi:uncharacterized protein (DUF3084 family)
MTEAGGSWSEGRGGGTPCPASSGSASGISELESVRKGIVELGAKISRLEEKVEEVQDRGDRDEVKELRSELKLLREKENLLRQEKLKLMDQRRAAGGQCASLRHCTDA